jgi:hypothetical protein
MTAVEWLVKTLELDTRFNGIMNDVIEQAKQMEKQQTEISDEEIEKESWGYREVTKDMEIPPNEDWSNGAKWYREQLKQTL